MTRLFLIPGLGADRELFYPQIEHFGDRLTVVDDCGDNSLWKQTPSMETAALAYIDHLLPEIPGDGSYMIGGMSFGGSLAMQMLRVIAERDDIPQPSRVILIASNRTSDTIATSFRINQAVGSKLPRFLIQRSLGVAAKLFSRREGLGELDSRRLREMADRADIDKLLWGAAAIADWNLTDDDIDLGIPIDQVHGGHDWVIPPASRHIDTNIEDGKHLITWTHRDPVNEWLSQAMALSSS